MAAIEVEAFRESLYTKALFPEHLRTKPGTQDQLDWRGTRMKRGIQDPATHYIVATVQDESGTDAIAGFAEWVAPTTGEVEAQPQPVQEKTPEERAQAHQKMLAALPVFMDKDAIVRCDDEISQLIKAAKPLFEGKKLSDMWSASHRLEGEVTMLTCVIALNSIAVSAKYRSKGIGKRLTRWGMEAADANGQDIWLVSAPSGRAMYRSLGFKEVAEGTRAGEGQYIMLREKNGGA